MAVRERDMTSFPMRIMGKDDRHSRIHPPLLVRHAAGIGMEARFFVADHDSRRARRRQR